VPPSSPASLAAENDKKNRGEFMGVHVAPLDTAIVPDEPTARLVIYALTPVQLDPAGDVTWEETRITGNSSLTKRTSTKRVLDEASSASGSPATSTCRASRAAKL
jgi:hypothetical protein